MVSMLKIQFHTPPPLSPSGRKLQAAFPQSVSFAVKDASDEDASKILCNPCCCLDWALLNAKASAKVLKS